MSYRKILPSLALLSSSLAWVFSTSSDLRAQAPIDNEETTKIEKIEVVAASLPESNLTWTKIVCDFKTVDKWTDGVSMNFYVLVKGAGGDEKRLLAGGLTYMNVPAGTSRGIIYISPNATERYGKPLGIKVEIFRGDRISGEKSWGEALPEDLQALPQVNGMLKSVYETPWLTVDASKSPDLLVR